MDVNVGFFRGDSVLPWVAGLRPTAAWDGVSRVSDREPGHGGHVRRAAWVPQSVSVKCQQSRGTLLDLSPPACLSPARAWSDTGLLPHLSPLPLPRAFSASAARQASPNLASEDGKRGSALAHLWGVR